MAASLTRRPTFTPYEVNVNPSAQPRRSILAIQVEGVRKRGIIFVSCVRTASGSDRAKSGAMAPPDPVATARGSDSVLQILNLYRLDFVSQFKTKYSGIKIELAIEGTLDVFRLPETMLLALERHVRDGQLL